MARRDVDETTVDRDSHTGVIHACYGPTVVRPGVDARAKTAITIYAIFVSGTLAARLDGGGLLRPGTVIAALTPPRALRAAPALP